MHEPVLRLDRGDSIGWITLSRLDALNAINDDIRHNLPVMLNTLEQDPNIRVIVIRAEGSRAFCVGADVKEVRPDETPLKARERLMRSAWLESVAKAAKPTIASIQGFCLGGGMELALACDIRIAAPCASFALPEVKLGLLPGGGGTQRLARLVGVGRALDMMLTGDRIDAQRAYELGIVTRLSASTEALIETTNQFASRLAANPIHAMRLIKEAVYGGFDLPLSEGLRLERNLFTLLLSTEDRVEAAAAFREKRAARFSTN